jgi:hypothetical protein
MARSHTRTVSSPPPETTTGRPSSSVTATAYTLPPCPVNVLRADLDAFDRNRDTNLRGHAGACAIAQGALA